MTFEFATAGRIIFGGGSLAQVGSLAAELGQRALVVGGGSPERLTPLLARLEPARVSPHTFSVPGEPTIELIAAGLEQARDADCRLVVAMGGGSALDAGKAIAALLNNPGEPLDYLEVVGKGRPLLHPAAPLIAIPTTAGTGSEVTRNAVLGVPSEGVKVSMRSPLMLPRIALIDPELAYSLPPEVTASTGLDALTQCLEPLVSPFANPLTDAICREGLRRASHSLRRAYAHSHDAAARRDMALASLSGGLALANAKLGAVHGFAGPLGGMIRAPHGSICAALLPAVTRANITALEARNPTSPALERYRQAAAILTEDPAATAEDAVSWIETLCADLKVSPLSSFGLGEGQIAEAVAKARRSSSMKGNPIELSEVELARILQLAS